MSLPTLTVGGNYEPVPLGTYDAVLTNLQLVASPFDEGKEQLEWTFTVRGGEYDGRQLKAYSSLATGPKAKLLLWASALLQRPLQAGETLDLNELLNKPCRITVLLRAKENGGEYNRIDAVLPAKSKPQSDPFAQ